MEGRGCELTVPIDWSTVMAVSTTDHGVIEIHRARWDVWMTGKRRVTFG
jgi:hypothetical protein